MEKTYWLGRKRAAMKMARAAQGAEARLIHYDLAGRYSVKAAQALPLLPAVLGVPAAETGPVPLRLPAAADADFLAAQSEGEGERDTRNAAAGAGRRRPEQRR